MLQQLQQKFQQQKIADVSAKAKAANQKAEAASLATAVKIEPAPVATLLAVETAAEEAEIAARKTQVWECFCHFLQCFNF